MDKQDAYHHGDLRRALLDAALELVQAHGEAGLTLRGVARAANVSHAAPYHHFKNKDALLAAVAEEGFRALRVAIEDRSGKAPTPPAALQAAAIAYVLFAVDRENQFRVMFGPQLADKKAHPTLHPAAERAYKSIQERLEQCGPAAAGTGGDPTALAVACWAAIHGLSMLLIDRQFGPPDLREAENLARQVTDVFWVGLSTYAAGPVQGSAV